jgi:hypothetical protein
VAALAWTALAAPAEAWGTHGHRIVAKLAMTRLTPQAKAAIRALLEEGEDLTDASTYPDEHKREIRGSAPWHYVNVPIDQDRYDPRFCDPRKGCVVDKIKQFRAVLQDPNADEQQKRMALRFVAHLIGDLHQPLHVGAFDGDQGGNLLQVSYFRRASNLHKIWDIEIIAHAPISNPAGLRRGDFVDEEAWVRALSRLAAANADQWRQAKTEEEWASESLLLAKQAYQNTQAGRIIYPGDRLGRPYQDQFEPRVAERLAQAGVRLADVLNAVFQDQ